MTYHSLKAGIYTSVFEIFTSSSVLSPVVTNETVITLVHGDNNYTIITFDHNYIDKKYTKAIIQFSSNGGQVEITFQIRYYGNRYNRFLLFSFLSRVIAGRQGTAFNHALFDVDCIQYNKQILYF